MSPLTLPDRRRRRLRRFRRNTWKAIVLCGALRLADTAFGLGLVESAQTLAAQDIQVCPNEQEFPS